MATGLQWGRHRTSVSGELRSTMSSEDASLGDNAAWWVGSRGLDPNPLPPITSQGSMEGATPEASFPGDHVERGLLG